MPVIQKGNSSIFIILILAFLIAGSFAVIGGVSTKNFTNGGNSSGEQVDIIQPTDSATNKNLQLKTLPFTVRPTIAKECLQTVAVDLLVDRSGSMTLNGKILKLKAALDSFTAQLSNDSVVGLQSFADSASNDVSIALYSDNKAAITSFTTGLPRRAAGYTYMRDAMNLSKQQLQSGIAQFPNRQFSFIFLTDGLPETLGKAPDLRQDPTTPPDLSADIKAMGVTIYTIGIMGTGNDADQRARLKRIASSPDKFYESPSGDDLTLIYNQIGQKLCQ